MQHALVVEDLPDARDWLAQVLRTCFDGVAVHACDSVQAALASLREGEAPDIALIDLSLPDGSGVRVIDAVVRRHPQAVCVVTSIYNDDAHLFPALRAGARGYLLKDQPPEDILRALKGIANGAPPISPAIARRMLSYFAGQAQPPAGDLSPREVEVLRLLGKGLTQAEAARVLGLSVHTVMGYVKEIYRKLNVSSRAEAALVARDMGLL